MCKNLFSIGFYFFYYLFVCVQQFFSTSQPFFNFDMFEIYYSEVDEWKSKIREFFNKVKATGLELKEYSKKTEEEIEAIMKRLDASKNDVSSEAKIANETD